MREIYLKFVAAAPVTMLRRLLLRIVLFVVMRPSFLFLLRKEADALLHTPAPLHTDDENSIELKRQGLHAPHPAQWLVEEMLSKKVIPTYRMGTTGCAECGTKLISTKGPRGHPP